MTTGVIGASVIAGGSREREGEGKNEGDAEAEMQAQPKNEAGSSTG